MAQFAKKSNKKWNLTTFEFFLCCWHPRLSHFQAENHRNVKYFKFLLVNRMMLYGLETFRKSSKQGHMTSKMATKAYEGPISLRLNHFQNESKGIKRPKCQKVIKVPTFPRRQKVWNIRRSRMVQRFQRSQEFQGSKVSKGSKVSRGSKVSNGSIGFEKTKVEIFGPPRPKLSVLNF